MLTGALHIGAPFVLMARSMPDTASANTKNGLDAVAPAKAGA
jgi:hypothetical protein